MRLVPKQYKRKALANQRFMYYWWYFVLNGGRALRARTNTIESDSAKTTAQQIEKEGIVCGPAENFLSDSGTSALKVAVAELVKAGGDPEVQKVREIYTADPLNRDKPYLVHLLRKGQPHDASSPFLRVALDQKILEAVTLYMGLWPRLHSIRAWLNYPMPGDAMQSQLWHRDPDDLKIVKVFIYLNDVNGDSGPFSYIRGSHPFGPFANAESVLDGNNDRISDDRMRAIVPEKHWIECTGPTNTLIMADTVGLHCGGRTRSGVRMVLTFTFVSGASLSSPCIKIQTTPDWITTPMQKQAILA